MRLTMSKFQQKDLSFEQAFDLFIRSCNVKNLTDESIHSYKCKIRPFARYFAQRELILSQVDKDTLKEFICDLRANTRANDVTINSYLRATRAFLYFCMEEGYVERFKFILPKAEKKGKDTYTEEELERLLKKPNVKTCDFTELKVWALENFLVGTGVRISTALNIQICNLDFDNGFIFIQKQKNRKQAYIPMSESVAEVLRFYLQYRDGDAEDYVFCNACGQKGDRRTYETICARYNRKRGCSTGLHKFRHTFGKLAVMNGIDAFRLQRLMGHSSITVTQEYVNLYGDDLAKDYERFNPLDNLMKKNREKIKMSK